MGNGPEVFPLLGLNQSLVCREVDEAAETKANMVYVPLFENIRD